MAKKKGNGRKAELAQFLRSRRAKVKLPTSGLSFPARRRTPGLRREEVAEMAGISLSWYTWLEQARDVNPSPALLLRLASILKLTQSEIKHLFALADHALPEPGEEAPLEIPPALVSLIQKTLKVPAFVLNARFEFVLWNAEFTKHFYDVGEFPANERSWLEFIFTDEDRNRDNPLWQKSAQRAVAEFRMAMAKQADRAWVRELVARLQKNSSVFPQLWKAYDILERKNMLIDYNHPKTGIKTYERSIYIPQEAEDLRIVILTNPVIRLQLFGGIILICR